MVSLKISAGRIFFTCLGTFLSKVSPGTFDTSETVAAESAGMPESLTVIALRRCGGPIAFHSNGHEEEGIEVKIFFIGRVSW